MHIELANVLTPCQTILLGIEWAVILANHHPIPPTLNGIAQILFAILLPNGSVTSV